MLSNRALRRGSAAISAGGVSAGAELEPRLRNWSAKQRVRTSASRFLLAGS